MRYFNGIWTKDIPEDSKRGRIRNEADLASSIYYHLRSAGIGRKESLGIHVDWELDSRKIDRSLPQWLDRRRLDVALVDSSDLPVVAMELKVFHKKRLRDYCKDLRKLLMARDLGSELALFCFTVGASDDYEWFHRRFTLRSLIEKCEGLQKTHDAFRKYEQNIESYLHIGRGFDSDYDSSWKLQPIQS